MPTPSVSASRTCTTRAMGVFNWAMRVWRVSEKDRAQGAQWYRTSYHLSTGICHIFTPSALPAHNESGLHHSTYDDATWPSGDAAAGPQYCVRLAHAAGLWPAEPHTRR